MSESDFPRWFPDLIILFAAAQTVLLLFACVLIWDWGSKLNRKLHRIESNTRHVVRTLAPEEEEMLTRR